jgi:hypothetical protein
MWKSVSSSPGFWKTCSPTVRELSVVANAPGSDHSFALYPGLHILGRRSLPEVMSNQRQFSKKSLRPFI